MVRLPWPRLPPSAQVAKRRPDERYARTDSDQGQLASSFQESGSQTDTATGMALTFSLTAGASGTFNDSDGGSGHDTLSGSSDTESLSDQFSGSDGGSDSFQLTIGGTLADGSVFQVGDNITDNYSDSDNGTDSDGGSGHDSVDDHFTGSDGGSEAETVSESGPYADSASGLVTSFSLGEFKTDTFTDSDTGTEDGLFGSSTGNQENDSGQDAFSEDDLGVTSVVYHAGAGSASSPIQMNIANNGVFSGYFSLDEQTSDHCHEHGTGSESDANGSSNEADSEVTDDSGSVNRDYRLNMSSTQHPAWMHSGSMKSATIDNKHGTSGFSRHANDGTTRANDQRTGGTTDVGSKSCLTWPA